MTRPPPTAAVIGAGPAGLMAAELLARDGVRVTVWEKMPSPARKFLMAGRGGLNLTHSEPIEAFVARYGVAEPTLAKWLKAFAPADLVAWAKELNQPTFVGTSGRVFPRALKASPLLRAWLARLEGLGVQVRTRARWTGWRDGALVLEAEDGERLERPDVTVLAVGGAAWPRLGSDGAWAPWLQAEGVEVAPFRPSNSGADVLWSTGFAERFAGTPLKGVALSVGGHTSRGEAVVTGYGLEGGGVYALSAALRSATEAQGAAELILDLRPDLTVEALTARLARAGAKVSLSNRLRKAGLDPVVAGLLREAGAPPGDPAAQAARLKRLSLTVTGVQGLERAISSAGGVRLGEVDDRLMLRARPGVFLAGEMLDWEAPTGGYLLQACFSSGRAAAGGALDWLAERQRQTP
jgi:uncharacterized flavoprotein (TIGR03862 family)